MQGRVMKTSGIGTRPSSVGPDLTAHLFGTKLFQRKESL
jgi:hypothetical protein